MSTQNTAPDFGEPWEATDHHFVTAEGNFSTGVLASLHRNRIAACVSACAGMQDPAADIQAMRAAIVEAHETFSDLINLPLVRDLCDKNSAAFARRYAAESALAKLKPFMP